LFFFLDADIVVKKNSLEELVKVMDSDNKVGIAQSYIISTAGRNIGKNFIDRYGYAYSSSAMPKEPAEIFYSAESAMLIKRELFEKLRKFRGMGNQIHLGAKCKP